MRALVRKLTLLSAMFLAAFTIASASAAFMQPAVAFADDNVVDSSQCGSVKKSFFGLPTWYKYLKVDPSTCEVQDFCVLANPDAGCATSSIPLILLAFIDIALRIGGLVAVGFVIVGGFKFVTSQGEPDGVKNARNTILNALIGLVIAIIATPIVGFIGSNLSK